MQEKIEKGEVDIVVEEEEEVVVEEVVDITTYKKVPSIQDYLKEHFYLTTFLLIKLTQYMKRPRIENETQTDTNVYIIAPDGYKYLIISDEN